MQTHLMDPVCGTTVDRSSPWRQSHQGKDYFFCSDTCRQTFEATFASGGP